MTLKAAAFVVSAGLVYGQAMVEHGLITGATGTLGQTMQKTGEAISQTTAAAGKKSAHTRSRASRRAARPVQPTSTIVPVLVGQENETDLALAKVNASELKVGMSRSEVMELAGKPLMRLTMPEAGTVTEQFTYQTKDGSYRVTLVNGKVTAVQGGKT